MSPVIYILQHFNHLFLRQAPHTELIALSLLIITDKTAFSQEFSNCNVVQFISHVT